MKKSSTTVSRNAIAKALGISGATVSCALSEKEGYRISEKTRRKVIETAVRMGYKPRFAGKALSEGKTYSIGVVLNKQQYHNSRHIMKIFSFLATAMSEDGYAPMIFFDDNLPMVLNSAQCHRFDGLIILQSSLGQLHNLADYRLPLVVGNADPGLDLPLLATVNSDHSQMVRDSINYLLERGTRKILFFNDPGFCYANTVMQNSIDKCLGKLKESGIATAQIVPDRTRYMAQLTELFSGEHDWDGYWLNAEVYAFPLLQKLAQLQKRIPGRDYQMITATTGFSPDDATPFDTFIQNQEQIGMEIWWTLKQILKNQLYNQKVLVPYRRENGCRLPEAQFTLENYYNRFIDNMLGVIR